MRWEDGQASMRGVRNRRKSVGPRRGARVWLGATALLCSSALSAAADPAFGHWLTENKRAIVEISPCDAGSPLACGRIVWSIAPHHPDGRLKTDAQNPDPALRNRPICGLPLISGLEAAGTGAWRNGTIYNARDGSAYAVQIEAEGDALAVRGYLGLPLFGQTQTWTREPGPREGCPTG